jgi:DMSO reductase anchor subunit
LFLALYTGELYGAIDLLPAQASGFYVLGSALALALLLGGIVASFCPLGHPEQAWRTAARWSSSWLSREVILLPLVMTLVDFYGTWAAIATLLGLVTRSAALLRNARMKHRVRPTDRHRGTPRHPGADRPGAMGGSFNTREFFQGKSPATLATVRLLFLTAGFLLPVLLIALYYRLVSPSLPLAAFLIQYLGLLAERWYFFAEARHPQNLYYQSIA